MGPFKKWEVDFIGPLSKMASKNQYIIVAMDYIMKWVEAKVVKRAIQEVVTNFIYGHVNICRFRCPLELTQIFVVFLAK